MYRLLLHRSAGGNPDPIVRAEFKDVSSNGSHPPAAVAEAAAPAAADGAALAPAAAAEVAPRKPMSRQELWWRAIKLPMYSVAVVPILVSPPGALRAPAGRPDRAAPCSP